MVKKKNEIVVKESKPKDEKNVNQLKEELTDYIDLKIKKEISNEIEKANKRVLREKNKKILFRNIVIIFLTLVIAFLLYLLNSVGYFSRFINKTNQEEINNKKEEIKEDKKEDIQEVKTPSQEELRKKYSYLINDYYINEKSSYLKDYYSGNLTMELKNYLALNQVNFNLLKEEDDYNVIDNNTLKEAYTRIFNDEYHSKSFDYDNNKIRYISSLNAYLTEKVLKKENTNIQREIMNIEVKEDMIIIKTIEGIVRDNKLYNINNEEIIEYQNDTLLKYQDKLNEVKYTFKNSKLISLN